MYEGGKFVAEDLRAFGQHNNFPVVTAAQLNRGGFSSTDPDLDDTAESFGITMPADLIVILSSTDELIKESKIMCFLPTYDRLTSVADERPTSFLTDPEQAPPSPITDPCVMQLSTLGREPS